MESKKIKRLLRGNDLTLSMIYLFKYKIGRSIKYHLEKNRIARGAVKSKEMALKLEKLKNSGVGKSCVIIGNGPSMRFEDLDFLYKLKIDTFASNRIVDVFDKTIWRPDYLCVMDPAFLIGVANTTTVEEYLNSIKDESFKIIFNDCFIKHVPEEARSIENFYSISCNPAEMYSTRLLPFSEDIALYVSDLGSVTHFCIQLACYMGYKEIYLYGMDNTYTKIMDDNGKFRIDRKVESYVKGIKTNVNESKTDIVPKTKFEAYKLGGFADLRKNNLGYNICLEYANKKNIKIYNITRGGRLDVFERKNFDDVFKA